MRHNIVIVLLSGNEVVGVIEPTEDVSLSDFIKTLIPEGVTRIEIREVDKCQI